MKLQRLIKQVLFLKQQGQGRYHSPQEIETAINSAQLAYFDTLRRAVGTRRQVQGELTPFLHTETLSPDAGSGLFVCQEEVVLPLALKAVATGLDRSPSIELLAAGQWAQALDSQGFGPTLSYPKAHWTGQGFLVLPTEIQEVSVMYLRPPRPVVYGTQAGPDGYSLVFDPSSSVDLEWGETALEALKKHTLLELGVAMQDTLQMQYGGLAKQQAADIP